MTAIKVLQYIPFTSEYMLTTILFLRAWTDTSFGRFVVYSERPLSGFEIKFLLSCISDVFIVIERLAM